MYVKESVVKEIDGIIDALIPKNHSARKHYDIHSAAVTAYAMLIANKCSALQPNLRLVYAGAMLHDIGIIGTWSPEIGCEGKDPYIKHGIIGKRFLEELGFMEYARFCECHIGVGISAEEIVKNNLPLPLRDMLPVSIEEKIVCVADKFFSKSSKHPSVPIAAERIIKKLRKHGGEKHERFLELMRELGCAEGQ